MTKLDTYTAQGAENLGRANPNMANPYTPGTTDWRRFNHGALCVTKPSHF